MAIRVPSGLSGRVLPLKLPHLSSFVESARRRVVGVDLDVSSVETGSNGEPKHPSYGVCVYEGGGGGGSKYIISTKSGHWSCRKVMEVVTACFY